MLIRLICIYCYSHETVLCVRTYGLDHASLTLNRSAAKMLFRRDHDIIVRVANAVVPKISHFVEVKFFGTAKGLRICCKTLILSHLIVKALLSLKLMMCGSLLIITS